MVKLGNLKTGWQSTSPSPLTLAMWLNSHAEMWELLMNMHVSLSGTPRIPEQLLQAAEIKATDFTGTNGIFLMAPTHPRISGSCQLLLHCSRSWKWDTEQTSTMDQMGKYTHCLMQQPQSSLQRHYLWNLMELCKCQHDADFTARIRDRGNKCLKHPM